MHETAAESHVRMATTISNRAVKITYRDVKEKRVGDEMDASIDWEAKRKKIENNQQIDDQMVKDLSEDSDVADSENHDPLRHRLSLFTSHLTRITKSSLQANEKESNMSP